VGRGKAFAVGRQSILAGGELVEDERALDVRLCAPLRGRAVAPERDARAADRGAVLVLNAPGQRRLFEPCARAALCTGAKASASKSAHRARAVPDELVLNIAAYDPLSFEE
jgi:hypothetical protein